MILSIYAGTAVYNCFKVWKSTGAIQRSDTASTSSVVLCVVSTTHNGFYVSKLITLLNAHSATWALGDRLTRSQLLQAAGDVDVLASTIPYGDIFGKRSGLATVREMVQHMDDVRARRAGDMLGDPAAARNNESPMYAFDPFLLEDQFRGLYHFPTAVRSVLGTPPTMAHQFYLGPRGSGSPLHFHEDALNMLVYGLKQWTLLPPSDAVYTTRHPMDERGSTVGVNRSAVIACVQHPGELVYVPRLWAHSTVNLAEAVGIAVEYDGTSCTRRTCTKRFL
eukprot:m.1039151 g.1039151  ORF g.1039151 m.1039151 type:complete len:279 (+) comp24148_c0_seq65:1694-2530(+)